MRKTIPTPGDTSWFVHDRFGMFIHWGLYALPARHEWVQHREEIPHEKYRRYFEHFDPDLYDPDAWARAAAEAGMKYVVITSKHHEGFCLWDTKHTDFKAPNTPARRDLLRPALEAFRRQGLRTGIYYSLIDWHHPDFVIDSLVGPYRNAPDRNERNRGRSQARYAEYMRNQVRELLTEYGPIDVMWCDYSYTHYGPDGKGRTDWQSEELLRLIRQLRPSIILNDRLDLPDGWDIKTPEQIQIRRRPTLNGQPFVWEACHTFSGSWGYFRDEESWKSVEQLVRLLIDTVSRGGNLLLNVGPTGRGEFDSRALERLAGIGEWMKRHSRAIYGCEEAPEEFPEAQDCRYTYNPDTNRLYVHVYAWPFERLHLPALRDRVLYAQLLHDASEVPFLEPSPEEIKTMGDDCRDVLTLKLPVKKPDVTVPVVELFLKDR